MAGVPEVLDGGSKDLIPPDLALLIGHTQHVAHHRRVALRVRKLVRVDVSNRANDGLQKKQAQSQHTGDSAT